VNKASIADALLRFLPAAVANMAPVCAKCVFHQSFTTPVDFGMKLNRHRIFGDSKTWRGVVAGVLAGALGGLAVSDFRMGAVIGAGAMFGDLSASFLKRRLGLESGAYAGIIDNLNFPIGAFIFAPGYWTSLEMLVILVLVPPAHRLANIIGHALKIKDVPW